MQDLSQLCCEIKPHHTRSGMLCIKSPRKVNYSMAGLPHNQKVVCSGEALLGSSLNNRRDCLTCTERGQQTPALTSETCSYDYHHVACTGMCHAVWARIYFASLMLDEVLVLSICIGVRVRGPLLRNFCLSYCSTFSNLHTGPSSPGAPIAQSRYSF